MNCGDCQSAAFWLKKSAQRECQCRPPKKRRKCQKSSPTSTILQHRHSSRRKLLIVSQLCRSLANAHIEFNVLVEKVETPAAPRLDNTELAPQTAPVTTQPTPQNALRTRKQPPCATKNARKMLSLCRKTCRKRDGHRGLLIYFLKYR